MVWFSFSIKIFVNRATGFSDKTNQSDNCDIHRVRSDSQSALSNIQCSAEGSSSLEKFSESLGSDHFHKDHLEFAN